MWKDILKKKTEKPTKVVDSDTAEHYDRDGESYGGSSNVHGSHFNNCDKLTGKNQRFRTIGEDDYEGSREVELDNCNCWQIAKDWYKESKLVREIVEDAGVGTLDSRGESSVHYNDGTDWEKLSD